VLQLSSSAASGMDKSSFSMGIFFFSVRFKFSFRIFMHSDNWLFGYHKFEDDHHLPA
jgi:hypothetical protein